MFAPFGTAALGIELPGLRVLADARAIYRWQWAADDRAQLQLGITLEPWFENTGVWTLAPRPRRDRLAFALAEELRDELSGQRAAFHFVVNVLEESV